MDRTTNPKALPPVTKTLAAYLSRLFLLDLWTNRSARPILLYALLIHVTGMILFNWLEGWGYLNSLYFTFTTLATIGYGDFVPTSTLAKIFTIFFSVNGIVLLLVLFDLIRHARTYEFMKKWEKSGIGSAHPIITDARMAALAVEELYSEDASFEASSHSSREKQISQHDSMFSQLRSWLFPAIALWKDEDSRNLLLYAIFIVATGAILFRLIEGWSWLNSTYFVIVTLTTIGYGDFAPTTPLGKIMTILYGLNGVVIFLGVFDSIRRRRHLQIRKVMRLPMP